MKYKITYQQTKGRRIKKSKNKAGFYLTKEEGKNQWYFPELDKWGEIDDYKNLYNGNYYVTSGVFGATRGLMSLKSVIRFIKRHKPEKGDVFKISKYVNNNIKITIK